MAAPPALQSADTNSELLCGENVILTNVLTTAYTSVATNDENVVNIILIRCELLDKHWLGHETMVLLRYYEAISFSTHDIDGKPLRMIWRTYRYLINTLQARKMDAKSQTTFSNAFFSR